MADTGACEEVCSLLNIGRVPFDVIYYINGSPLVISDNVVIPG